MNMRKIIAVLAAVLMLCSVIPMGALSVAAAPGDVVVDFNFDDGSNGGFERSVNENGYIVFDATTADWQNTFAYLSLKSDTMYKVTFKAKANKDAVLNFKVQNGWTSAHIAESVDVTTEWQDFELTVNSGIVDNGAIVLFTSGYPAGSAPIYYIDDLKIVEILDPALIGKVVNGDFETGDKTGWEIHQSTAIDAEAAHDGSFGAHLKGNGSWGGMLNQAVFANAGKSYEISLWVKVVSNGVNIQVKDGNADGSILASQWLDANAAAEWKQLIFTVIPTTEIIFINFCGGGNGVAEDLYVDDVVVTELKDPSFDGYITNGDFEIGKTAPWDIYGQTAVTAEAAKSGDYGMMLSGGANWGGMANQDFTVEAGKTYVVRFDMKVINQGINVQIKDGGNNVGSGYVSGTEWTTYTYEFTPTATNANVNFCGSGTAGGDVAYLDNVMVYEKVEQSNDGYIVNGTFDTGALTPWNNLWGSCPTAEVIVGGKDSTFALHVVSGQWLHVRQLPIAVEANTNYKITLWAKDVKNMSLLVKDAGDTGNIANSGINGGAEWTENVFEFNSGDNTAILVSFMGGDAEAYGTFDSVVMEKVEPEHVCEFVGQVTLEATCTEPGVMTYSCTCGEGTYTEEIPAWHNGNLTYVPAVEAIDCANPGHIEYYTCPCCNEYFTDANASEYINPWYINVTVDCVRPEGVADCATWTCEVCGNENYGYGEHDTGVPACQDGHCSKCDQDVAGFGHQNYDGPACLPGNCYYCGEAMEPVAHENGAWAPCLEGECAYGCGLTYPATAEHVDEDGDDYCDTCWNHLAHVDADGDGYCDICWSEMPEEPVEIVYGDANGDGVIDGLDEILLAQYLAEWDVELNMDAADANGDGVIDGLDEILLAQYLAEWDVTLGPIA